MAWLLSDPYSVEEEIEALGSETWRAWVELVRPQLLADPYPTNSNLTITETLTTQVWIPGTDIYVLFHLTGDSHVMLVHFVDLLADDSD